MDSFKQFKIKKKPKQQYEINKKTVKSKVPLMDVFKNHPAQHQRDGKMIIIMCLCKNAFFKGAAV